MKRGACPTLRAPMQTGDGWLARLPPATMPPGDWVTLAEVALTHGNGLLDITARGSVQIRGLTASGVSEGVLRDWPTGALVMTSPLAGEDPTEITDPRPLAARIAHAAPDGLPPKTTVLLDGGGALHLAGQSADLRLMARVEGWELQCGAVTLHALSEDAALDAAMAQLRGPLRGRVADTGEPAQPIGVHTLREGVALGVALPYGRVHANALIAFAAAADARALRGAPGRALLVLGPRDPTGLRAEAARLGFITEATDPRLQIVACPGSAGCASGLFDTRALAEALAPALPPLARLHISGCAKGCAHPGAAPLTLVGVPAGLGVIRHGRASDPLARCVPMADARHILALEFAAHA